MSVRYRESYEELVEAIHLGRELLYDFSYQFDRESLGYKIKEELIENSADLIESYSRMTHAQIARSPEKMYGEINNYYYDVIETFNLRFFNVLEDARNLLEGDRTNSEIIEKGMASIAQKLFLMDFLYLPPRFGYLLCIDSKINKDL